MPDRITFTPSNDATNRSAHEAFDIPGRRAFSSPSRSSGYIQSEPPRIGSITITGMPSDSASFRPFVPAWFSISMKLNWIWQASHGYFLIHFSNTG